MNSYVWLLGWLVAVAMLIGFGIARAERPRARGGILGGGDMPFLLGIILITVLASLALSRHDVQIDLTHGEVFTASPDAQAVVADLTQPVKVTFFGHDEDPNAKRIKVILKNLALSQPLLKVQTVDPDKEPTIAKQQGVKFYNVAIIEAGGERVIANTTDEIEIALAIQKALRITKVSICFVEGHGEYPSENHEFHTHVESVGGGQAGSHGHGHAHLAVVQTTTHGLGRYRRALEGLGYETASVNLITSPAAAEHCSALVVAGPQHQLLPDEIEHLARFHKKGASLLLMFDLAYQPSAAMAAFLQRLGLGLADAVIVDDKQHYDQDAETIAISSYDPHPVTRQIAMTIFPGSRPLKIFDTNAVSALVTASPSAINMALHAHNSPQSDLQRSHGHGEGINPVVVAGIDRAESINGRIIVTGDVDFLSNSYFPYLSNNALGVSMMRWLVGEERAVNIASRLPVIETVVLTQTQMRWLFGVLVLGVPVLVLLFGALIKWRCR